MILGKFSQERIRKISERLLDTNCARIAVLWEEMGGGKVRCLVCERRCVIPPGMRGMCGARYNHGGELYVLTYGNISSISNNPMAKKPFFNFYPDKYAITVGSWGCNFTCPWCQNWEISKLWVTKCNYVSSHQLISIAKRYGSAGTSFSFNEPSVTLLEYSLDVMRLAKKEKMFNTYVSNGFMTLEALELLVKNGLDAINIDIKGCKGIIERWIGADVEYVWRNAREFKKRGVHVEITTLVIPKVNDDEKCLRSIARRIRDELGPETPWHVTRYFAEYRALEYNLPPATPIETIEKARKIGVEEGLKYVYVGNIPNHPWENTYCPECGELIIRRGYSFYDPWRVEVLINEPVCPKCGAKLDIVLEKGQ